MHRNAIPRFIGLEGVGSPGMGRGLDRFSYRPVDVRCVPGPARRAVRDGVYHAIFDNVEDSLSLSRLQCFDFQGVNNEQYADLIEPLMLWLLRHINDVF
jgi:hypothetical protein